MICMITKKEMQSIRMLEGAKLLTRPIAQVIHSPRPSVAHLPSSVVAVVVQVQVLPLLAPEAAASASDAVLRPLDEDVLVLELLVLVEEGVVVVQLGPPVKRE